ncbi:hypothetical protein J6590_073848 [Homalodisca vitripennis]|nr:hypothetical protein J6590_073848 [Homalodisca vitripennis]
MRGHIIVLVGLLRLCLPVVLGFSLKRCFLYPCLSLLREVQPLCGVETSGNVRVFRNPCLLRKSNWCLHTQFEAMNLPECFKKYPYALNDYVPGLYRLHL